MKGYKVLNEKVNLPTTTKYSPHPNKMISNNPFKQKTIREKNNRSIQLT
jgi:hypothetical protein